MSILLIVIAHAKADPRPDGSPPPAPGAVGADRRIEETGVASWYGRFFAGRRAASGTHFDDRAFTAAHLWLPLSTTARVTNLANGRSVDVIVNDRGPYREGRIIDLSAAAATALGMIRSGLAEVLVTARLAPGEPEVPPSAPPSTAKNQPKASPSATAPEGGKQPALAASRSRPRAVSLARPPKPANKRAAVLPAKMLAGRPLRRGHRRIMLVLPKKAMTRAEKPLAPPAASP